MYIVYKINNKKSEEWYTYYDIILFRSKLRFDNIYNITLYVQWIDKIL